MSGVLTTRSSTKLKLHSFPVSPAYPFRLFPSSIYSLSMGSQLLGKSNGTLGSLVTMCSMGVRVYLFSSLASPSSPVQTFVVTEVAVGNKEGVGGDTDEDDAVCKDNEGNAGCNYGDDVFGVAT
uniref:Uncharacterized protein n=1 Tax=Lygus hesperus TaxID=30085 RepID=A0A0A9WCJ2_LYGHE